MKAHLLQKLLYPIIDFVFIGTGVALASRLLSFAFPPIRWVYLLAITYLYYTTFYLLRKQTIGQQALGVKIRHVNGNEATTRQILRREALKILLVIAIPRLILELGFRQIVFRSFLAIVITAVYVFIVLLVGCVSGRNLWEFCSKTTKVRHERSFKSAVSTFVTICLFGVGTFFILMLHNNIGNDAPNSICGFKVPFKLLQHPINKSVAPYQICMKENGVPAKDYVLSLFENYDIVVLEESVHDECHPWDLIYDIVSDDYFVNNVGTIFTEYGEARDQADIDSMLRTRYADDESRSKAAAAATHIRSGGYCFHKFLKKINILNENLPDSLKISVRPEEIGYGKYFSIMDFSTDSLYQQFLKLDSLRAQVTIDWYRKTGKKCLVVTNTRHAYICTSEAQKRSPRMFKKAFEGNQMQYVYDSLPGKVANVHYFDNLDIACPNVMGGKWEAAFRSLQYQPVGFDLEGTVFGDDYFDLYNYWCYHAFRYQDIFTGIVFYTPAGEAFYRYPAPYLRYAAKKEYETRLRNGEITKDQLLNDQISPLGGKYACTLTPEQLFDLYEDHPESYTYERTMLFLRGNYWHYLDIFITLLLYFFGLFVAFLSIFRIKVYNEKLTDN
ncbi:MAG: RDD family protein [Bacteroidales bacterium]|nr:RDD family protein [Bacteroidales bacterium]